MAKAFDALGAFTIYCTFPVHLATVERSDSVSCSPLPEDMSQALEETHAFAYEPDLEPHGTRTIGTQADLVEIDCSNRNIDCKEIDVLAPPHLGSAALQAFRVPVDIGAGAYTVRNCLMPFVSVRPLVSI